MFKLIECQCSVLIRNIEHIDGENFAIPSLHFEIKNTSFNPLEPTFECKRWFKSGDSSWGTEV